MDLFSILCCFRLFVCFVILLFDIETCAKQIYKQNTINRAPYEYTYIFNMKRNDLIIAIVSIILFLFVIFLFIMFRRPIHDLYKEIQLKRDPPQVVVKIRSASVHSVESSQVVVKIRSTSVQSV